MTIAEVVADVHPPLAVAMALQFALATQDVTALRATRCGWSNCRLPMIFVECSKEVARAHLHPVGFTGQRGHFLWTECDCIPF